MATLLQLHFAFNGPFGDAMAEQLKPLAESINQEPCAAYPAVAIRALSSQQPMRA